MVVRQSQLREHAGEAEAVQQPEAEGREPRRTTDQRRRCPGRPQRLERDGDDAGGDQRLDRGRRQMDDAEHGQREAHAVRGGERGDGEGELPPSSHQEHECEEEEEMIGAAQNVLDAERTSESVAKRA